MAGLSYLKRVFVSSMNRRNAGNFIAHLGIASRVSGFWSARSFSSDEDVETRNGRNEYELKPDRVRCLFDEYGFTPEQVNRVSKSLPLAFSMNIENLSSKLEFLRSILGSDDDVAKVVATNPRLLCSTLKNKLIPSYTFIKSILDGDELIARSIKRSSRMLHMDVKTNLAVKVDFLKESGFPSTSIAKLMDRAPRVFDASFCKLEDVLKKAMSFGFEPRNPMIVFAIKAIGQMKESVWDRKVEVYRKWGFSDDDFVAAFRKQPYIMSLSEKKINKSMDVYLNEVGLSSSDIVKHPTLLCYSVEGRIVPRCSVLAVLLSKGVLDHKPRKLSTYYAALTTSEEAFVRRYVDKYAEHVLELWPKLRRKDIV